MSEQKLFRIAVVGKAAEALEELFRRFAVAGMSRQEFILTLLRSVDPDQLRQKVQEWEREYYERKAQRGLEGK